MTLHRLLVPLGGYTYWWYAAIPNERRGRIHILRVPYINIEEERVRVPPYGNYDIPAYQRRNAGLYIPSGLDGDGTGARFCNTRQNARRWSVEYGPPRYPERNVCPVCFQWQQHNVESIGFPIPGFTPTDIAARQVRTCATLRDEAHWVQQVERRYYGASG